MHVPLRHASAALAPVVEVLAEHPVQITVQTATTHIAHTQEQAPVSIFTAASHTDIVRMAVLAAMAQTAQMQPPMDAVAVAAVAAVVPVRMAVSARPARSAERQKIP